MTVVAVSILNHGGASATLECLRSLLKQRPDSSRPFRLEIFLVDNGSGEAEQHRLQEALPHAPNLHLDLSAKNLGFAAGHNRNLRTIRNTVAPDFVWLLNNDCVAQPDCVARLLECATESPQIALWGATLLEPGGKKVQCAGGCRYNAWISSFRQIGSGAPIEHIDEIRHSRMDYVAGASLFLPTQHIDAAFEPVPRQKRGRGRTDTGFLNETFFLYFEELDLARRLKKSAYGMGWCRDARIVHSGGLATGATGASRSARAEYHATLSALKFTRIYHPYRLWVMMPARFAAKCVQLGLTGHSRHLRSLWHAYRDFLAGT